MTSLLGLFLGPIGLIGSIFWIWMLYDCLQRGGSDRQTWLWVLLFLNIIGAFLYFFQYWLPRNQRRVPIPQFMNKWRMRDALWQAEADAYNIGKSHQYMKLGNILFEIGEEEKALAAYCQAIEKEPKNCSALWGAARLEINRKNFDSSRSHLKTLLAVEPNFAFGDASSIYGQVLFELNDFEGAIAHLQKHLGYWSHPECYITLASAYKEKAQINEARNSLETMILKIKSSTPHNYRKNQVYVRQGERMLKSLK